MMRLELIPFPSANVDPAFYASASKEAEIKMAVDFSFVDSKIQINYELRDLLNLVVYPDQTNSSPKQKNHLWEETCFEFFLKEKNSKRYWEWNFAPNGDWNQFEFYDYRLASLKEKPDTAQGALLPFPLIAPQIRHQINKNFLHQIEVNLDLSPWRYHFPSKDYLNERAHFQINLSSVLILNLKSKNNLLNKTYWAISHPTARPDFHAPEGFIFL